MRTYYVFHSQSAPDLRGFTDVNYLPTTDLGLSSSRSRRTRNGKST